MTGASARPAHGSPVNTVAAPGQTLDRRRVYIFPSRAGVTFAIVLFIILLGAAMLTAAFRAFGGEELVRDFLNSLPGGFWSKFIIVMFGPAGEVRKC